MSELELVQKLMNTEQSTARDENLELIEKIEQMTEYINKLKAENRGLEMDYDRIKVDMDTLKIKYEIESPGLSNSPGKIFRRPPVLDEPDTIERSKTLESITLRPVEVEANVTELRKTIVMQSEIINTLRQENKQATRKMSIDRSHVELTEDAQEFKLEVNFSELRKYSKHMMKKSGILANLDPRYINIESTPRNYGNLSERNFQSELNFTPDKISSRQIGEKSPKKVGSSSASQNYETDIKIYQGTRHEHKMPTEAESINDSIISYDHIEMRNGGRAQTAAHNLSLNSSSAHFEEPGEQNIQGTPKFPKQMLTPGQMVIRAKENGNYKMIDAMDAMSEKRPSYEEVGNKTNRQRISKDQLNAKGAIFSQFYKNFRNTPKKSTKSDFSRDYLGVINRTDISGYLERIKDPSKKVFSDAISIFRHPSRKYQYILVVTCKLSLNVRQVSLSAMARRDPVCAASDTSSRHRGDRVA